ncbi:MULTISPECIES: hypothetical protein [Parachlamydia]|jgi:hypothetical protein|uniref:hypothetical protein n=1 Tax=Parachlamydia TaxID=83551 RepID=UPI0001C173EA|nr:hypothetical protein [Parachlamydia acanthamoebae]EFB41095.1 hypothetical protein pah_c050o053 [Parachlamydia acanthamoebae str. Hall's coccus]
MGFSATGNFLSGSAQRPDIITTTDIFPDKKVNLNSLPASRLNSYGYIPFFGTVIGTFHLTAGSLHTAIHFIALAIFKKNRAHHLSETKLGLKNIGRGFIEIVPGMGFLMYFIDNSRVRQIQKKIIKQIDNNRNYYNNYHVVFYNGELHSLTRIITI